MVLNQSRSKRKPSGGRYKYLKVRRQYESGGSPALTRIGASRIRVTEGLGCTQKHKLLTVDSVYVMNPATQKVQKATIIEVLANPANRHFVRRNIITKGARVNTSLGPVVITSRPGQFGSLQGVLVSQ